MESKFQFPEVENAYKPSGKISFLTIPVMLFLGGAIALVGGYLLGSALPGLDNLSREAGVLGLIIEIFLKIVLSVALGYGIALGVYGGGKIGKNRNIWVGAVIGFICGLTAFVVMWSVGGHNPRYGGYTVDPLMAIFMFCSIVFIPVRDSAGGGAAEPFCEQDNCFMIYKIICKLPISSEREAINLLSNRQFTKVAQLPSTDNIENYSIIEVWYCRECLNGYISMATHVKFGEKSERRLVFSSILNRSETEMIIGSDK